eukprot:m.254020 g.254020  ORF g.254020 m.254020 type:complete len:201 (+) comp40378_c0_seq6:510-1112(+)
MASLHGDQGNYQKQLDMLDFAQSSISQLQLPLYYRECGKALEGLNRHEEALVYFTKTLDSLKIVYPGNSPLLSVALFLKSHCLRSLGRYTEAVKQSTEGLAMARSALPGHARLCSYLFSHATNLLKAEEMPEALCHFEECLSVIRTLPTDDYVVCLEAKCLCCLGWIWSKMGKERDAINAFEEALKLPESAFSKLECNQD